MIWQSKNGCTNLVNTKLWNLLEKFEDAQGVVRSYKLKDRRKRTNKTINGMQNTTQTKQHELHTKKATYIFKERLHSCHFILCSHYQIMFFVWTLKYDFCLCYYYETKEKFDDWTNITIYICIICVTETDVGTPCTSTSQCKDPKSSCTSSDNGKKCLCNTKYYDYSGTCTLRKSACPQVFSSGGTCTLLPSFLGVHPNFWGCNVPSNSSFGGTKKMKLDN